MIKIEKWCCKLKSILLLLLFGSLAFSNSLPMVNAIINSFTLYSCGCSLWLGEQVSGCHNSTHQSDDVYHVFKSDYWLYEPLGPSGIGYYYSKISYNFSISGIPLRSIISIEVVGEAHRGVPSAVSTLSIYDYYYGRWDIIGSYGTNDSNITWTTTQNITHYIDSDTKALRLQWYLKTPNLSHLYIDYQHVRISAEIDRWAVIVCGGAAGGPEQEDLVNATKLAYRTLLGLGYDHENIYYLSVINDTDADGDGQNDVDEYASKDSVEAAITDWLVNHSDSRDVDMLYVASHGGKFEYDEITAGYFVLDSNGNGEIDMVGWPPSPVPEERIMDSVMASWIDQVTYATFCFVIEACYSGTFINDVSDSNNRIVISSTTEDKGAMNDTVAKDIPCFTFFTSLDHGSSIGEAFNDGWQRVQDQWGNTQSQYDPLLDDNGDGEGRIGPVPHSHDDPPRDGELAMDTWP